MEGLKKQKSIKINFDTLPDKKRVMEITLFLSNDNKFNPQSNPYEAGTSLYIAVYVLNYI